MSLNVLIAPSGFKEGLSAEDIIECVGTGVRRAIPDAAIRGLPLVDGGEGFTKTLVKVTGGTLFPARVTGPVGQEVEAFFGILGGAGPRTGVIEMAAAAGLRLVPRDLRDPSRTTSYGVGQLIRAALDAGVERLIVGCGDSGINDGGAGMAQALGVRLLDADGDDLGWGGGELRRLDRIDLAGRDPRLDTVTIEAAVNWYNVLLGAKGVARVFGPQKGATPEMVDDLDQALTNYARVLDTQLGTKVGAMPGGGASGGLGAGLHALVGCRLRPRYEIVMRYLDVDTMLEGVDLVITAEGSIDAQTPRGKAPAEIARRAKHRGLPVIAFAGTVGRHAAVNLDHGIDAFFSIAKGPCTLEQSMDQARELLTDAAEQAARALLLGLRIAGRRAAAQTRRRVKAPAELAPMTPAALAPTAPAVRVPASVPVEAADLDVRHADRELVMSTVSA